jgi:phenylpropionate dioxygenase-like ring-hydroxylating dioxygenase large terminal subunit
MGREVIVFRGGNGVVSVVDSHCPHLGAHFLASGGSVVGDTLRCGFHGFRFSGDGKCVATGYDSPPPKGLCVPSYEVVETHRAIFVWFDPEGGRPLWELPVESDANEWSPIVPRDFRIPVHLVDQVENAVDRGHFQHLHLGQEVEFTKKPLFGEYEFSFAVDAKQPKRVTQVFKLDSEQFVASLAAEVRGLGWIRNHINLDVLGCAFRVLDPTHLRLRPGLQARLFHQRQSRARQEGAGDRGPFSDAPQELAALAARSDVPVRIPARSRGRHPSPGISAIHRSAPTREGRRPNRPLPPLGQQVLCAAHRRFRAVAARKSSIE